LPITKEEARTLDLVQN